MGIPASLSSVPDVAPYIQYIATAGQTVYPYPFPITQDADLVVVVNGVSQSTDSTYSVSGVGVSVGGNVTMNSGSTAGDIVTLYRDIQIERISQIAQNSGFSSQVFNNEFNNFYLIAQQLQASLAQCLKVPNTNSPAPVTTIDPVAYANKYQGYDANGNPEPVTLTSSGALTASIIAGLLNGNPQAIAIDIPRTAAEISAGVTPVNLTVPPSTPMDLRRYGQTGSATPDTAALTSALAVANGSGVIALPPNYAGSNPTTLPSGITIIDYRVAGPFPTGADLLGGGKWINIGGNPEGSVAGFHTQQWVNNPVDTTSAILGTNKVSGDITAAGGAMAGGTFELDVIGALSAVGGNIVQALTGQIAIRSTGHTLPFVVGVEGGGGIDRSTATTNITTWVSVQGDAVVNNSTSGATITNAYGGRFIQSTASGITNNNFAISSEGDCMFRVGDSLRVENGSGLATIALTFTSNNLLSMPAGVSLGLAASFGINGATPPAKPTGYGTPTGGALISSFTASSMTLGQVAAELAQLITDLKKYGLIA